MRRVTIPLLFFALSLIASCRQNTTDSDLVLAAFSLGVQARMAGPQRVGATGAIAAMSATGSGLNTGSTAFLLPRSREKLKMLALIRRFGLPGHKDKRMLAHKRHQHSAVIPATFDCTGAGGNNCANAMDDQTYTLDGSETCDDGAGTVAANTVDVTFSNDGDLFSYDTDGTFTYTACGTYSVDFENYPDYKLNTLSGTIYSNGSISSTVSETDTSTSGFTFVDAEVITTAANNFRVNGGPPIVMDVTLQSSESKNLFYDPADDEITFGTASANITIVGTIDGSPVNYTTRYVVSFP